MNEKVNHDLAVAYAQAKLFRYQQEYPDRDMTDEEIRAFLKAYYYASAQLKAEYNDLDKHF